MRWPLSPRQERLALMLLALLLIGAGLGWRQPLSVDEERFLGIALEMLQDGSWFIPHRAGEIYPDKPPLFMWVVALCAQLSGAPHIALFLPALLAGVVMTACLHDLGCRLWNRRVGVSAALLFLATYQTFSVLRAGQIDGFLCLWIAVGVYGLIRHLLLGPAWGWFYLACTAMGFGIISKGVGFLPLLLFIPWVYAVNSGWRGVATIKAPLRAWLPGALFMLLAVAVWLLPLLLSVSLRGDAASMAYVKEILLRQTAQRYTNAWHHREPFWYFWIEVIPKYWLPVSLALPWLLPAWWRQLRKQDGRVLVLLGWVLLVLLFFTLSTGKRKLYIFPAVPGLMLLTAQLLPWLWRRRFTGHPCRRQLFTVVALVWFNGWLAWGFLAPLLEGKNQHQALMQRAAKVTGGADLLLIGWREGHWLFARQPIVHFGFESGTTAAHAAVWLRSHPHAYALIPSAQLAPCFDRRQAYPLGETTRSSWFLVGPEADTGSCRIEPAAHEYRFEWRDSPRGIASRVAAMKASDVITTGRKRICQSGRQQSSRRPGRCPGGQATYDPAGAGGRHWRQQGHALPVLQNPRAAGATTDPP